MHKKSPLFAAGALALTGTMSLFSQTFSLEKGEAFEPKARKVLTQQKSVEQCFELALKDYAPQTRRQPEHRGEAYQDGSGNAVKPSCAVSDSDATVYFHDSKNVERAIITVYSFALAVGVDQYRMASNKPTVILTQPAGRGIQSPLPLPKDLEESYDRILKEAIKRARNKRDTPQSAQP